MLLSGFGIADAQSSSQWPDTFESRVQVLALMQTLNAEILSGKSATAILEQWCRDHRLAEDPKIVAKVSRSAVSPPSGEQRNRLHVSETEAVKYRRVQLRCGNRVLSEAENWYVPARLTAEMNRLLESTETPFGKVVQPMAPYRVTIAAKLLWSPLPPGWETGNGNVPPSEGKYLEIPTKVFEHRAVLYTSEHEPFAEVNEIYQGQILDFRPHRTHE